MLDEPFVLLFSLTEVGGLLHKVLIKFAVLDYYYFRIWMCWVVVDAATYSRSSGAGTIWHVHCLMKFSCRASTICILEGVGLR